MAGFQPGVSESRVCALNRCLLLPGVGRGLNPILGCCFRKPNLQTLFSLQPAPHFPGLGPLTVSSLSGPPVPVPASCQRLCIYRTRSPVRFCSHLAAIWAWSPLAAVAAVPQVSAGGLGRAMCLTAGRTSFLSSCCSSADSPHFTLVCIDSFQT